MLKILKDFQLGSLLRKLQEEWRNAAHFALEFPFGKLQKKCVWKLETVQPLVCMEFSVGKLLAETRQGFSNLSK